MHSPAIWKQVNMKMEWNNSSNVCAYLRIHETVNTIQYNNNNKMYGKEAI